MAVKASYEFSGLGDRWSDNGRRWEADAGCLFAHYGPRTTLAEIVDQLVDDFNFGGDCDSLPEEVTDGMIREAIMSDMLSECGRAAVASGAVAECAAEYTDANDFDVCRYCGASIGEEHTDDCDFAGVCEEDDCEEDSDCCESPMFVVLIEVDICPDCGAYVEDVDEHVDGLCSDCAEDCTGEV